jgi:hypothetical protein
MVNQVSSNNEHFFIFPSLVLILKFIKLQSIWLLQNSGDSKEGGHQLNMKYQNK